MQDKLQEILNDYYAGKNRLEEAQALIEKANDVDPNSTIPWTLFILALNRNLNDFAKLLIEKGLAPPARQPENGSRQETALHLAAYAGNLSVTTFLVEEKNADLNAKNVDDEEPETALGAAQRALKDEDITEDPLVAEGLTKIVAYLQLKQEELNSNRQSPLASDSPLHSPKKSHTTPPTAAQAKQDRMRKSRE
jgi:hypothetical protein